PGLHPRCPAFLRNRCAGSPASPGGDRRSEGNVANLAERSVVVVPSWPEFVLSRPEFVLSRPEFVLLRPGATRRPTHGRGAERTTAGLPSCDEGGRRSVLARPRRPFSGRH